jgi:hypothetical protein
MQQPGEQSVQCDLSTAQEQIAALSGFNSIGNYDEFKLDLIAGLNGRVFVLQGCGGSGATHVIHSADIFRL